MSKLSSAALQKVGSAGPAPFEVVLEGVGLHTGKRARVRLRSDSQRDGIRFESRRAGQCFAAPALWTRLSATSRSTSLVLRGPSRRRYELKTIEHLMAALFAAGFPHLVAEIEDLASGNVPPEYQDTIELPVLDGSARDWMPAVESFLNLETSRPVWIPVRSFEITDGTRGVLIAPWADGRTTTEFECAVDFGPRWVQHKNFVFDWMDVETSFRRFRNEIAPARTFGFAKELEDLARRGLVRGGSLENALLLDDDLLHNDGGFRVDSELAAHKLLDAVGDFALLGCPILGSIRLNRAGHSIHLRAVEEAIRKGALVQGWIDSLGRIQREP